MTSWTDGVASWVVAVLYAIILAVGTVQVGARYLFNMSIPWTEELAVYLFIWLVFLGAGVGVARGVHPRVSVFVDALPARARRRLSLVVDGIVAVILVVIIVFGYRMVVWTSDNVTPALGASVGYAMYLALPVGAALMLLNLVLRRLRSGDGVPGEDNTHP